MGSSPPVVNFRTMSGAGGTSVTPRAARPRSPRSPRQASPSPLLPGCRGRSARLGLGWPGRGGDRSPRGETGVMGAACSCLDHRSPILKPQAALRPHRFLGIPENKGTGEFLAGGALRQIDRPLGEGRHEVGVFRCAAQKLCPSDGWKIRKSQAQPPCPTNGTLHCETVASSG